jgi:Predicted periplasmic lipoprotein
MGKKKFIFLVGFLIFYHCTFSQEIISDTFHLSKTGTADYNISSNRKWVAGGITAAYVTGSLVALNQSWYKGYTRTSFHTFDDKKEWLQVDKAGHGWSAYTFAKTSTAMWKWAGIKKNKSVWIGGISSLGFMTVIEFLDGYSAKWGWSWMDMAANIGGIGLYSAQELTWNEQRIQYKFSSHTKNYDASLQPRTNDLFGNRVTERLLKDYNNQTYWLSVNLKSFFKESNLPPWLNMAVGYGAEGMLGGFENAWTDKTGTMHNRYDIQRVRQFYISPDIDFTKIKTDKKAVKTLLEILSVIKMPAPALMLDSKGKFKAYALYF